MHFKFDRDTFMSVCSHDDSVSLSVPGHTNEGTGCVLDFTVDTLGVLCEVVYRLQQLYTARDATDEGHPTF